MKKFLEKIYCLSRSNKKVHLTCSGLNAKRKYKQRSLKLVITFTKRNLFISFSTRAQKKLAMNKSAKAVGLKGGYQVSRKILFLLFQQMKKNFSRSLSKDIIISLKGQSWLKKRVLRSFISYWGFLSPKSLKSSSFNLKSYLEISRLQVMLVKNNSQKAFNGCRVRKQRN